MFGEKELVNLRHVLMKAENLNAHEGVVLAGLCYKIDKKIAEIHEGIKEDDECQKPTQTEN